MYNEHCNRLYSPDSGSAQGHINMTHFHNSGLHVLQPDPKHICLDISPSESNGA